MIRITTKNLDKNKNYVEQVSKLVKKIKVTNEAKDLIAQAVAAQVIDRVRLEHPKGEEMASRTLVNIQRIPNGISIRYSGIMLPGDETNLWNNYERGYDVDPVNGKLMVFWKDGMKPNNESAGGGWRGDHAKIKRGGVGPRVFTTKRAGFTVSKYKNMFAQIMRRSRYDVERIVKQALDPMMAKELRDQLQIAARKANYQVAVAKNIEIDDTQLNKLKEHVSHIFHNPNPAAKTLVYKERGTGRFVSINKSSGSVRVK
jgi:hypothetical protein